MRLPVFFTCLLIASSAQAFEETARYKEVDAGVHIPVLTKAPTLVTFIEADYPPGMQEAGVTARVRLRVTIKDDGTVGDVTVIEPVGNGFDEAAIDALQRFVFTAAEVDFKPATVQIEYVYNFVLKEPEDAGVPEEVPDAGPVADAKILGTLHIRGARGFVPGALVRCDNHEEFEVFSDDDGKFELPVVGGEDCYLRIASSEYELFTTTEYLESGETRESKYFVLPRIVGYQTVIRGVKDKKEVVKRTVSRAEVQKMPGTFGDPIRVIQNFPGVARAPFGLGQLIVRGANPNQTLTFFDGVEIPLLFHLAGGPSVINGEFLDRIDFYPGGFGARYGRAVGGVVDVAGRQGAADTWHGVAKVDLLDASLFVEAPIANGVSVAAAARRSYIDAIIPAVTPQDAEGGTLLALPAYWDYQVRLDVGGKKGEKLGDGQSQFSIFAFGSDDTMRLIASGGGRNVDVELAVQTSFHRLMAQWGYRKGNTTFKLTPYLGFTIVNASLGGAAGGFTQFAAGARADLSVEATDWLTVRGGTDIKYLLLTGGAELPLLNVSYVPFPGAEPKSEPWRVVARIPTFDGALYTEADVKMGPVTVTPGVRVSTANISGQTRATADPRLWARVQILESTAIKGSLGLYSQPPSGLDMQPPPLGTPTLTYERAFQTSLGVSHQFTEYINVDVTGFFNRRYDNVVSPGETIVNDDGSITRTRHANKGLGRAYGVEVMARHEVSKYVFGWIAYTFNRSEEKRDGSDDDYIASTFDQTHILTAVVSVNLPWDFTVGARFRYVTGRPTTRLDHRYDVLNIDSNGYSATWGPTNGSRLQDFHQLDFRIDKDFIFEQWKLTVFLDIQNIYNQANVEATFYDYRFRREYIVPGIPILPVFGVKASL